jgi:hypothetical protein
MSTKNIDEKVSCTVALITLVYRGRTQEFTILSQAIHFLRSETVKIGWFHKITATVDLIAAGDVRQTQTLRGQKFAMITALEQLKYEPTQPHA